MAAAAAAAQGSSWLSAASKSGAFSIGTKQGCPSQLLLLPPLLLLLVLLVPWSLTNSDKNICRAITLQG
jgi:hypothetical protein